MFNFCHSPKENAFMTFDDLAGYVLNVFRENFCEKVTGVQARFLLNEAFLEVRVTDSLAGMPLLGKNHRGGV
jgi:hypothetical protein